MPRAPLAPELVQLSDSARIWPTPSVMTVTEVSIAAFDLGPIIAPEPSTWTMMLLGVAGLGVVARRRRTSALVLRDAHHNPAVPHSPPRLLS
jgi:PEP-CTERM motif